MVLEKYMLHQELAIMDNNSYILYKCFTSYSLYGKVMCILGSLKAYHYLLNYSISERGKMDDEIVKSMKKGYDIC
ncbi:MAG: hypothetical protein BAJALOKI1v1_520021 [Promethearchaeota archaeon]|nr:MAG: hypothetical protein BAJALOKI1v1_520021 [Candidatus Lokiarchaeota archaeon]